MCWLEILDKREVRLQSPNMEREELLQSLSYVSEYVNIEEVITDNILSQSYYVSLIYRIPQDKTSEEVNFSNFFVKFSYACK